MGALMTPEEFYELLRKSGTSIRDASNPDFHYGISATKNMQPFNSIVLHHATGDVNNLVKYGQNVDQQRGGAFGYHFYIAPDGSIVQGAPFDKRTNHIEPTTGENRLPNSPNISNNSALGISLVNAQRGYTPEQRAALERLVPAVQQKFSIDPKQIFGHGELQSNRMSTEGQYAKYFRQGSALPDPDQTMIASNSARDRSLNAYLGLPSGKTASTPTQQKSDTGQQPIRVASADDGSMGFMARRLLSGATGGLLGGNDGGKIPFDAERPYSPSFTAPQQPMGAQFAGAAPLGGIGSVPGGASAALTSRPLPEPDKGWSMDNWSSKDIAGLASIGNYLMAAGAPKQTWTPAPPPQAVRGRWRDDIFAGLLG